MKMRTMKIKNELLIRFLEENKLKPVYIYEDLHLEDTKNIIRKETSDLGGIYLIFNKITGDYYVGSASTNRLHSRLSNHLIYFKGSKIVKHAVRKYKLSNFAFLILEILLGASSSRLINSGSTNSPSSSARPSREGKTIEKPITLSASNATRACPSTTACNEISTASG